MSDNVKTKNTGALNTLCQTLTADEWRNALETAKSQRAPGTPGIPEQDRRDPNRPRHQTVRRCLLRVDRGDSVPPGIYVVRSSDISGGGLRLVHGGHIEQGAVCCVIIESTAGRSIAAGGTIAWCNPINDTDPPAYELGIRFYKPINADIFAQEQSEAEDAA